MDFAPSRVSISSSSAPAVRHAFAHVHERRECDVGRELPLRMLGFEHRIRTIERDRRAGSALRSQDVTDSKEKLLDGDVPVRGEACDEDYVRHPATLR